MWPAESCAAVSGCRRARGHAPVHSFEDGAAGGAPARRSTQVAGGAGLWQPVRRLEVAWCILEQVELVAVVMVEQDSGMAMRVLAGARLGVVLKPVSGGASLPGRWVIP